MIQKCLACPTMHYFELKYMVTSISSLYRITDNIVLEENEFYVIMLLLTYYPGLPKNDNRMNKNQNPLLLLLLVVMMVMSTSSLLAFGQETSSVNGQQTANTSGQTPTINYYVNPPPNPTTVQPVPSTYPPGVSNGTDQGQDGEGGAQITDPIVLAIAFVGAAAGVIYRTIYPYFERLHEMEVQGEEPIKFLTKYKFTFGISLLISLATTVGLFSGLLPQLDVTAGLGMVFISSFVQGIGWNELTNRVSYKITDRAVDQASAKKSQPSIISTAKEVIGVKEEKGQTRETPKIIGRYPLHEQTHISVSSPIIATFSTPMDISTISRNTFDLRKDGSNVSTELEEIRPEENHQTIIIKPKGGLEKDTKYTITVSKEVKDQAGNKIDQDEIWSFTTGTA